MRTQCKHHHIRLAGWGLVVGLATGIGCKQSAPPPVTEFPVEHLGTFHQANGHLEMDQHMEAIRLYASLAEPSGRDAVVLANWAAALTGKRVLSDGDAETSPQVQLSDLERCMREPSAAFDNSLLPDAERCARAAHGAAPHDPDIALVLCAVLEARARDDEALALLRETVDAHPDHAHALFCLLTALDKHPEVPLSRRIELHDRLLTLRPLNVAALLEAMVAHAESGNLSRALELGRRIEAIIVNVPAQFAVAIDLGGLEAAVAAGDDKKVLRTAMLLKNIMKGEDRFRSDIIALGRKGDEIPLPIGHPHKPLSAASHAAISATLRFDKSELGPATSRIAVGCVTADRLVAIYGTSDERPGVLSVFRDRTFVDLTESAGLATAPPARCALFIDADNDRLMDLVLWSTAGPRLFRQLEGLRFENITGASGLSEVAGLSGAVPFDYDHDGDLDLLMWGSTALSLQQNDGEGHFGAPHTPAGLDRSVAAHTIIDVEPVDLDDDGDIDLAVTWMADAAGGGYTLMLIANERMTNFRHVAPDEAGFVARPVIADVDHDGRLEILDVAAGRCLTCGPDLGLINNGQPLPPTEPQPVCAIVGDFDNSGAVDVVTFDATGGASLPGVRCTRLERGRRPHVLDIDQDGRIDVISPRGELWFNRSTGTGNWLNVGLVGVVKGDSKFNTFGLGSTIELRAGRSYSKQHARSPWTHFGLGPHRHADVMRILWPNGNYQHIEHRTFDRMALKANHLVVEEQSLKGSCPYLYAWNGERFEFVTDVLWRSALGMSVGMGQLGHHGSADDYFKIAGDELQPDDRGQYVLQFTSELQEIAYFDFTRLMVVDHPAEIDVYVDEKCQAPPYPPFELFKVRAPRSVRAVDHRGHDVSDLLARRDGRTVHDLTATRYQGVVEPHDLVLDLGAFVHDAPVKLFLSGWVQPTDASINVALSQNPTTTFMPPQLAVARGDDEWQPVDVLVGFPSGKNKTIVVDLTGRFPTADHRIKLTTTMAIFWDQAWCTVGEQRGDVVTTVLPVAAADLHERGFSRAFPRFRHGPVIPQYDAPDRWRVWREATGAFTRCGDVTDLVTAADSRTIILGAGDEVTLRFDGSAVPPLPAGWQRDYVIHTDGWLKDGDLNTASGATVEPLPFVGMPAYPYEGANPLLQDAEYRTYLETFNTRVRHNAALRGQLKPEG